MKIVLGVCGSIAAYKSIDLARLFVKNGYQVKVILTRGAQEFVNPKIYAYLGVQAVYTHDDDFNYPKDNLDKGTVLHVELAKWADKILIAPLSANTLAKFCHAEASDLLTSLFLASKKNTPWLFFPAMNTEMLTHSFVEKNLKSLAELPQNFIHESANGMLACGDSGAGKLPDIETIFHVTESYNRPALNKTVLISTGATISPLDPVRYLTNASSGLTGFHLAKVALERGYSVTVIAGKFACSDLDRLKGIPHFQLERVTTTSSMKKAVEKHFKLADIYISSAAISDIEFKGLNEKMKKSSMGDSLPISKADDVLSGILKLKQDHQKVVGFAAETNLSIDVMKEKFNRKPVDLLVGTWVNNGLSGNDQLSGFANDSAKYGLMSDSQNMEEMVLKKSDLPAEIFDRLQ